MRLLIRYLVKQNLFLLFAILLAGTSLYLLTDIFERMDNIIESGVTFSQILLYFVVKLPLIISQILPAVFLLSLVAQFNLLDRNREMTALQAGGISPMVLVRFVLVYGLIWSGAQLVFSQFLGVEGERIASALWQNEFGGKGKEKSIKGLWFTEKDFIIHLDEAYPEEDRGEGFRAYKIGKDNLTIEEMVKAESFTIKKNRWVLEKVTRVVPGDFSSAELETEEVKIRQNLEAFQLVESRKRLTGLSLWDLSKHIRQLQRAGSNVELLRTAWHGKISYAASLVIMGMLALIITQRTGNIYKAVVFSMLVTFIFYTFSTFTTSMGEKGLLSPIVAAWMADVFFFVLCLGWFVWSFLIRGRASKPKKALTVA